MPPPPETAGKGTPSAPTSRSSTPKQPPPRAPSPGKKSSPPPGSGAPAKAAPPAPGSKGPSQPPPPGKSPGPPPPPGGKSPAKSPPPPSVAKKSPALPPSATSPSPNTAAKKSPGPPPPPGAKSPMKAPPPAAPKKPPPPGAPGPPPSPGPGAATPPRATTPSKAPPPQGVGKGPSIAKRSPNRSAGPKQEDGADVPEAIDATAPAAVSPKKMMKRPSPSGKKSLAAQDKNKIAAPASSLPAGYTSSVGLPHKVGDIGAPPPSESSGVPSARLVIAADKDVIEDWRERNIHGDVPFNVPVKDVVERLLLLRLKWDAGLEGLVPVETRGNDFISMMPVPEVVIPVSFTPRELGWEPGLTYFVWLQRSGKLDGVSKSRNELYRERLRAFYQYYAPDKEREVDAIVTDFEGSEELLFARLSATYGPEPTEAQLRRRKFQVQNDGVPLATLHATATSSIGSTIRQMQIQHLKDTGRYDVDKEERQFNPNRPSANTSEQGSYLYGASAPAHPRGQQQRAPAALPLLPQSAYQVSDQRAPPEGGDGFASGLIKHALTSVMTRMSGSLLLALYYKRWFLHRQIRQQQRRICNYLRGSFDVVLRRDYYEKWKNHLGTRRMRRQVQQSTQLAAKSEGLVGDLMSENSMLKGELKRLRTQVEMLDSNNSKRLETLYSSSELAIGQIRTLTAENHQKEQLIQQLEQRLMHVGNLMLKANDEKENALEHTAAEKVFLLGENERLQHKTTLLEEALEGANKQLDEWRPRPQTASCEHCPHYFDLERDLAMMHKNADVLRARVKDVESEKQSLRETTNALAAQLRGSRAAARNDGGVVSFAGGKSGGLDDQRQKRSTRRTTPLSPQMHSSDYFNGRSGYASSDGGSPPPPPPPDGDSEDDGVHSGDSFDAQSTTSAYRPHRDDAAVNTLASGNLPNNMSLVGGTSLMPRKIFSSAFGQEAPLQLPTATTAPPTLTQPAPVSRSNTHVNPSIFGASLTGIHAALNNSTVEVPVRAAVRTLADSFQDAVYRQQTSTAYRAQQEAEEKARQLELDRQDRWRNEPEDRANRHYHYGSDQYQQPTTAPLPHAGRVDLSSTAAPTAPLTSGANLSLETYFQAEQQRSDERLRMTLDRQTNNRLRTSGFSLEHGTIRRDVEERYKSATQQILQPTLTAGAGGASAVGGARSVFAAAATSGGRGGYSVSATGGYRVGNVASDQAEMMANREAAGESILLRGAAPHERPKAQPERVSVVTSAQGLSGIPPADPLQMRRSVFSYSMPPGRQ